MALPILLGLGAHLLSAKLGSDASNQRKLAQQETAAAETAATARVLGRAQGDQIGNTIAGMGFTADSVNQLQDAARAMALDGDTTALSTIAQQQQINQPLPSDAQAYMGALGIEKAELQNQKLRLENAAMMNPAVTNTPEFIKSSAEGIMARRRADLAPHAERLNMFDSMNAAAMNRDVVSFNAALTMFLQSLDGGVVRDAETGRYMGASGAYDEVINEINRLMGKGPTEETFQQVLNVGANLAQSSLKAANEITQMYDRETANWAREFVIPNLGAIVGDPKTYDRNRTVNAFDVTGTNFSGATGDPTPTGNVVTGADGEPYQVLEQP